MGAPPSPAYRRAERVLSVLVSPRRLSPQQRNRVLFWWAAPGWAQVNREGPTGSLITPLINYALRVYVAFSAAGPSRGCVPLPGRRVRTRKRFPASFRVGFLRVGENRLHPSLQCRWERTRPESAVRQRLQRWTREVPARPGTRTLTQLCAGDGRGRGRANTATPPQRSGRGENTTCTDFFVVATKRIAQVKALPWCSVAA
jgi:hypothetical protein